MLVAPPIGLIGLLFVLSIFSTLCTLWLLWRSVRFWYVQRAFAADFFNRRTVVLTAAMVLMNTPLSFFLWPVALLTCVLLTL